MKTAISKFLSVCISVVLCMLYSPALKAQPHNSAAKKNVLFIAVDDLRPELGCYGATYMKTPNIDKLAQQGLLFENAYCQQAICAPSRNSVMTGLRPDALNIYDLSTFFRKTVPNVVTLPQQFKDNGYTAEAIGKIYHDGHGNHDDSLSWSVPSWNYRTWINKLKKISRGDTTGLESSFPQINGANLPYYKSNAPEEQMVDGAIASIAVERIKALKKQGNPFFLAVGFKLPHLPFVAPAKYWDMYDPNNIAVPDRTEAEGASKYAFIRWSGELRKYYGIEQYKDKGYLPDELSRNLIQGYYASVSMIDAQVGKLLDALEQSGQRENTIIVFWGDHGWKLGEYGYWCKHSNSELDTHAPLIISAPGFPKGKTSKSLAEFVDIYPTLCELAGVEKPAHLQGLSLTPILKNPKAVVNQVALSQYPRGKFIDKEKTKQEVMGYSITDGRYRFTRWQSYKNPKLIIDKELYDHTNSRMDTKNLANSAKYSKELIRMENLLNEMLAKYK